MDIAIVGHGPSPTGQGWGPRIDACDLVARFWECHWQNPADYGERYDVGLFTSSSVERDYQRKHQQREPMSWWCYDFKRSYQAGKCPPAELIHTEEWEAAIVAAGFKGKSGILHLSRGAAAACHAIRSRKPDTLYLVGFDGVRDANLPRDHYPARYKDHLAAINRSPKEALGGPSTSSHNWAGERMMINRLAAAAGTRILWGFGDDGTDTTENHAAS